MITYTEDQKIQIKKAKERVEKQYPGAFLEAIDGFYTINDKEGNDILSEYMLPYASNPVDAWKLAMLTVKTTQNFNRTHPERVSLELEEEKQSRIKRRRNK